MNPELSHASGNPVPLLNGQALAEGLRPGTLNYILLYSDRGRQNELEARKAVSLYSAFRDRVQFVTVNLDQPRLPAQQRLVRDYYQGYLPHVLIVRADGQVIYDAAGPTDTRTMVKILSKEVKK